MTIQEWDAFVKQQYEEHPIATQRIGHVDKEAQAQINRLREQEQKQSYHPKGIKANDLAGAFLDESVSKMQSEVKLAYDEHGMEMSEKVEERTNETRKRDQGLNSDDIVKARKPTENEIVNSNSSNDEDATKEKRKKELAEEMAKQREEMERKRKEKSGWER